ncbi:MAG TPA: SH3 domain-containing protein [Devosiaceae bacterium]|jgi:uncharacterized protein YraI
MHLKKSLIVAVASAAIMFGSIGAALADPGVAITNVNVRSGPGLGYSVVDLLRYGDRINVEGCRQGWCYVDGRKARGWVSSQYLADVKAPSRPGPHFRREFGHFPKGGWHR